MSISPNTVNLASVILNAAPAIIGLIKGLHAEANPGATPPTDADVLAELQSWAVSTLAIDEAIKAERDPVGPTLAGSTGE